ncbi:hypothetical protein SRABI96_01582 [Peribacillus sp. Bi96]|nr:hypothetical protein [Peribacillus sp. Bi96]CAH0187187.1 hypothetical protein SRABI96_01582 [Peribacillus sp. Bi96]
MKEILISRLRYLEKQENKIVLMAAVTGSHSFGLSYMLIKINEHTSV